MTVEPDDSNYMNRNKTEKEDWLYEVRMRLWSGRNCSLK